MPGATVTIHSVETNQTRTVVTDSSGAYRVPALPVGHYDIKVEHGGFKTETQTGLNLEVGQEAVVDFTLQVGTTEQTVQVTGEAQQVNTTNSTLGSVVGEQTISDLPLNGRNYVDLTLLAARHHSAQEFEQQRRQPAWNGFQQQWRSYPVEQLHARWRVLVNTYAISAASGTGNTLGVDGIREYKVVTNNFSAEYGMTMGSQTVLVSKSGTNNFHGDAFEFIRNSVLDAANYFDEPTAGKSISSGRRPSGGTILEGLLEVPIQKDKTFFFAAYEGLRESIGQTIAEHYRAGQLLRRHWQIRVPLLSGGVVNAASLQVFKLFPKPNLPVGCTIQRARYYEPLNLSHSGDKIGGKCASTIPFRRRIRRSCGTPLTIHISNSVSGISRSLNSSRREACLRHFPRTTSSPLTC